MRTVAPMIVLIDAGLGKLVESLHRLRETIRRNTYLLRKFRKAWRRDHVAAFVPPLRHGLARHVRGNHIVILVRLIQDKPYRHAGRACPVMHLVNPGDHVAIGRRFVYKAIARGIHDHRSRQRAFENAKMRVLVGVYVTHRTPPGVVHQIEPGTNALPGTNGVARIAFGGKRPFRACGMRQITIAHFLIVGETAGGQRHAAPRLVPKRPAALRHLGAHDATVLRHQRRQGRIHFERNVGTQYGVKEPTSGALPRRHYFSSKQPVCDRVESRLHELAFSVPMTAHPGDRKQLEQQEAGVMSARQNRRAEIFLIGAKQSSVEGNGFQGAAFREAASRFRVIVRISLAPNEARFSVIAQELDHLRTVLHKRFLNFRGHAVADRAGHVAPGPFLRVR